MKNITKNTIIFLVFISILQSCDGDSEKQKQGQSEKMLESKKTPIYKDNMTKPVNISIDKIPAEIKYEGKVKNAVHWTDKLGENIVITTETGIYQSSKFKHEMEGGDAELFAYHFIKSNGDFKQTWKVYDFISDCPVDIVASFIDKTFNITDLNHNGIAEVWLMYETVCHGDVSPMDMKIIMYEGQQKFAMRGKNKIMYGSDENGQKMYDGGKYQIDNAFSNGPTVFLEFAKKLWNKNITGTWK